MILEHKPEAPFSLNVARAIARGADPGRVAFLRESFPQYRWEVRRQMGSGVWMPEYVAVFDKEWDQLECGDE